MFYLESFVDSKITCIMLSNIRSVEEGYLSAGFQEERCLCSVKELKKKEKRPHTLLIFLLVPCANQVFALDNEQSFS